MALSRPKHGFDSRWGYSNPGSIPIVRILLNLQIARCIFPPFCRQSRDLPANTSLRCTKVKNDASPRARAVGERLIRIRARLNASSAAEAIAGEVVVIVVIIVAFIAGRASVPA